mgnify:CR=1 FL=1|tara:strand:+ start:3587 stop:4321 length:735 start_codon:yes stop_codon:yes gene_type:complete
MSTTLTFSEKNKGWTSFHNWYPNLMCSLNNKFFTIKDGQLWEHHDRSNIVPNTFYGVKYPSKITTVLNDAPSEDKIYQNLVEEGTHPWSATIETNLTNSTISVDEFNNKESKWMAHTRKNEDSADITDRAQGIGVIISFSGLVITFTSIPTMVNVGDNLYQLNGSVPELIGTIESITATTITVNAITTIPVASMFSYALKSARVQGSEIRGYYAKVTLENNDNERVELFAINSNIKKSYVPTEN